MFRAIKVKLYPNKQQEQVINKLLGCYRFLYNQMLAFKQKEYDDNKENLSLSDLSKYFRRTLNEKYPWLKEQNTKVMQQSIRQMLTAYEKFLSNILVFLNLNQRKINYQHYFRQMQSQKEIRLKQSI